MKQVAGWLTEDDKFFARREEAELHEATAILRGAFVGFVGPGAEAKFPRWVFILNNLKAEIRDYFNATWSLEEREEAEALSNADGADGVGTRLGHDQADDGLGNFDEAHEQLPVGGPDAVSDLGARSFEEEIRDLGQGNGLGGWGDDAQSVFSGEDLAIMAFAEIAEARPVERRAAVRHDLEEDNRGDGEDERRTRRAIELVLRDLAQPSMGGQSSRSNPHDGEHAASRDRVR